MTNNPKALPSKKIGDMIYYASLKLTKKNIPCEVCFGNKYITCILGNGKKVTVECRGCERGYLGSTGVQEIYDYEHKVELARIYRIEVTNDGIEYYTNCGRGKDRSFEKKEDAIAKCKELARDHHAEKARRIKCKEKPNKDWTWHVYYHQKEMKRAEQKFFYHQDKLDVAKEMKKKFPRRKKGVPK